MKRTAVLELRLELCDEVEDLRLDRRVEAGRGLVEDQERGILGERHRDHDALLHAAGELVRVAAHHGADVRDLHLRERGVRALDAPRAAVAEHGERLRDLRADAEPRVQRRAGVLVDHRDRPRVVLAERTAAQGERVRSVHADGSVRHAAVARQVADDRERGRRLAAAGLADEAVRPATLDRERDAAQHGSVDPAHPVGEPQVFDVERERRVDRRAHRSYTSRIPSATRFTQTTRLAIASAGKNVIHQ